MLLHKCNFILLNKKLIFAKYINNYVCIYLYIILYINNYIFNFEDYIYNVQLLL